MLEQALKDFVQWLLAQLTRLQRYVYLSNEQQTIHQPTAELYTLLVAWVLEWLLVIEYIFDEWMHTFIVLAVRVPTLLLICFLYWFWLWAMSVWRRTQYGKFTRGERKLWAKALTAFWVAELVTALSFVLIFGCLSWGPAPLVPRVFNVSRKGIILELVIFSYILMLAYIAKMTMKWNGWRSQVAISSAVLIILSYLLWKDVMLLVTRENLYSQNAARWRNMRTNAVVYTLSHEWWTVHATTQRAPHARHDNLLYLLQTATRPDFTKLPQYSQYELNNIVDNITKDARARALCPALNMIINYAGELGINNKSAQPFLTYPRRTGFVPKRISMWQLLVILKMWHHLVLVLWWALYIYRLLHRQKTAYAFLGSCAFNVFCCLILALVVYSLSFFQRLELLLKFKPTAFGLHRWLLCTDACFEYLSDAFCTWNLENATLTR